MSRKLTLVAAAALMLAAATAANAATIDVLGSTLNGNGVTDLSTSGLLTYDLDLENTSEVLLEVTLDSAELASGSILWNAVYQNFMTQNLASYTLELLTSGVTISAVGDVTDTFGDSIASVVAGTTSATLGFGPGGEAAGFDLGDPLLAGNTDWELDVSGLSGNTFTLRGVAFVVPEPGTGVLAALGLALLGAARRRSR